MENSTQNEVGLEIQLCCFKDQLLWDNLNMGEKNLIMKPNWLLSLWLILYFWKICISKDCEDPKLWKRNSKVWKLSWSEVKKRMWGLKHQSKWLKAWTLGNPGPYPRMTLFRFRMYWILLFMLVKLKFHTLYSLIKYFSLLY